MYLRLAISSQLIACGTYTNRARVQVFCRRPVILVLETVGQVRITYRNGREQSRHTGRHNSTPVPDDQHWNTLWSIGRFVYVMCAVEVAAQQLLYIKAKQFTLDITTLANDFQPSAYRTLHQLSTPINNQLHQFHSPRSQNGDLPFRRRIHRF